MVDALRHEEEPISGDAEMVLVHLADRPLASTEDCVASMDLPAPRVRDALRELKHRVLSESTLLGWTRPRVERIYLPEKGIRRLGISLPTWHDEGNLSHILQRLPLAENFYLAAGAVEGLGAIKRFQWISGRSLDAAVDYQDGWVAILWSGLLESESGISARLENLGQDLLDLVSTGEVPFPAKLLFVVEDWLQRCLVQRAVRHLPMADVLVDIWCIDDGDCPRIEATLRSRGRISQPVPARRVGNWPWAARVESSPWSMDGNLALGRALSTVAQFAEARTELVKQIFQESGTGRGAQRSLTRLLNRRLVTRRRDGRSYLYRPSSAGYNLLALRDGVSAPNTASDDGHAERQSRDLQRHEDGWRSLIGLWAAAGAFVASGERSWEDMGTRGGIYPDGVAYLSTTFGLSPCYVEYERSALGKTRITEKLNGYMSKFRQDWWPVLAVCYNDSAERIFHDVGRQYGLRMLTTTIGRLGEEGPWRCWSWYGRKVEVSLPGITTTSFARRLRAWLKEEQKGWVMDEGEFQKACDAFAGSDSLFGRAFGPKKWWKHTREYLSALLVQSQGRRNAENPSECAGLSPRALHRFPSKEGWNDEETIGRLQKYLVGRLSHPDAVWEVYGGDLLEQVQGPAEVARQGRGARPMVTDIQSGVLLAYVSPLGRALVDKRLYLPKTFTSDSDFCAAVGVPDERRSHRSKTELALEMLDGARGLGHLEAKWVAGDDTFGISHDFREAVSDRELRYVLNVPAGTKVWLLLPASRDPAHQGSGHLHMPRTADEHQWTMQEHADAMPKEAWREISVTEGGRGTRTYVFTARRAWETQRGEPGEELWAIWRRNLDGSNLHCYLSQRSRGCAPGNSGFLLQIPVARRDGTRGRARRLGTGRLRGLHLVWLASSSGPVLARGGILAESAAGWGGTSLSWPAETMR